MKILISGASIAGPALAYWLATYGFDVTVVERAPSIRRGGYAVDIRGAALAVIDKMGLRETLRPYETDTLGNAMVDANGKIFGHVARGFGVIDEGDIEIHRGDLAQALYEATSAAVTYRFREGIAHLDPLQDSVSVAFESGEREAFDLVVGADGVHSHTRALAFGPEKDFLRELGSSMAIFTAPNHLGLRREQLLFAGLRRIASVKSANQDRDLKICVFFSTNPGAFDYRDVRAQKKLVRAAFQDAGWEFPQFLAAMDQSEDFYADVTCQIEVPSLAKGRVALVGDAGYCPSPLSGQGSSLALVGAYVLAKALAEHSGDVARSFADYDRAMLPFARKNQDVARKIAGGFAPKSAFALWSRNALMRMFPYLPGKGAIMKMAMGGVREASRAIALGDQSKPISGMSGLASSSAANAANVASSADHVRR